MDINDETVYKDSKLGKHIDKIHKGESRTLLFRGKKIPIISEISIGRGKSNDITVDDKMASRQHAFIQKIKDEYYIKDLNSTNGTRINGEFIPKDKYAKLSPGDKIMVGKTTLSIG
jgi:pSer/pThr/pTyr-binding forkhead associated (FHA) protein